MTVEVLDPTEKNSTLNTDTMTTVANADPKFSDGDPSNKPRKWTGRHWVLTSALLLGAIVLISSTPERHPGKTERKAIQDPFWTSTLISSGGKPFSSSDFTMMKSVLLHGLEGFNCADLEKFVCNNGPAFAVLSTNELNIMMWSDQPNNKHVFALLSKAGVILIHHSEWQADIDRGVTLLDDRFDSHEADIDSLNHTGDWQLTMTALNRSQSQRFADLLKLSELPSRLPASSQMWMLTISRTN
jgi:hypothetical protein